MRKLAYLLPVLVVLSCGSRKRELQKSVSEFDYKAKFDTSAVVAIKAEAIKTTSESLRQRFLNTRIKYQGKAGDSLSVQKFGPDGKLEAEYKFKGTGSADLSEQEGESDLQTASKTSENTTTDIRASASKKIAAAGKNENKNVKVERTAFPWWLWLILIVLVIVTIRYVYRRYSAIRKTMS